MLDKDWHKVIIFRLKPNCIWGKRLSVLHHFLRDRTLKVTLNVQVSLWTSVNKEVLQGPFLAYLPFLAYMNDLPNGLQSNTKLFAGDAFLLLVIYEAGTSSSDISSSDLNNDLYQINEWTLQRKISFNPGSRKQA